MSESEYAERPNKTQLKREIRRLNLLGQALVKLPPAQLDGIPLSDNVRDALLEAKRLQKGALQRQYRRIASLMQNEDIAAIELTLQRQKLPDKQAAQRLHQIEQWRDKLVAGDQVLLTQLIADYPDLDNQFVRQLIRNIAAERKLNKPPKAFRALFQHLNDNTVR